MGRLHFDCRFRYPGGFELSAAFEAGDGVTALFGPSGCGKSTILGLIAGTLRPDAGRICLGERILADVHAGICVPPEQRQVGVVFQDQLLFPHLTVEQNLRFGHGRRRSRTMDFGRVVEIIAISDLLNRLPGALSGGQRQRVALGRALLRGPELLLLDEPLTALDAGLKHGILDFLEQVAAAWHIPTLFVSHSRDDMRRLAQRVVVIQAGRVIAWGPTADMLGRIPLPLPERHPVAVTLLRVVDLRQNGVHWDGQVGEQRLTLPSGPFEVGGSAHVRLLSEDVSLIRQDEVSSGSASRLEGVVRDVLVLSGEVLVAVDVGQIVWARESSETVEALGLQPGRGVSCLVRTSALTIVASDIPP